MSKRDYQFDDDQLDLFVEAAPRATIIRFPAKAIVVNGAWLVPVESRGWLLYDGYGGRASLGHLILGKAGLEAVTAEGRRLGTYPTPRQAANAIIAAAKVRP